MRHYSPVVDYARQRLKARIKLVGIPYARLAKKSGVSVGTIFRILNEPGRDISLAVLGKLAEALLIDVRELLAPLPPDWVDPDEDESSPPPE